VHLHSGKLLHLDLAGNPDHLAGGTWSFSVGAALLSGTPGEEAAQGFPTVSCYN
jgi:hypothetical protein